MKDYIYTRLVQAEQAISEALYSAKITPAYKLDYSAYSAKVMEPLNIKSMPKKYRDQISATFWFCWKREITNNIIFPDLYKGKLYAGKWRDLPEGLRKLKMSKCPKQYLVMHQNQFTEGQEITAEQREYLEEM